MRCLARLSHKEFGTVDTTCMNTNGFLIPVIDIVRFGNDAIVGKASEISRDVGLRIVKVHELGLGFPKVHEGIKGTRGSFNSTPE